MTKAQNSVEFVVFDLGRVLLDFSFDPLLGLLAEHGVTKSVSEMARALDFYAFEHGHISRTQFAENLQALLPNSPAVSVELLTEKFVKIFTPKSDMLALLKAVRREHPTFILSNTNELHWDHLIADYDLLNLADDILASFHVGAMKPDRKIYEAAAQRFKLDPARSVFIDDIAENAAGAQAAGWHGIHHQSADQTAAKLRALGVRGLT